MYLARRVHPDKCEEEGSKEAFFKLQEAFAVLADPDLHATLCHSRRIVRPPVGRRRLSGGTGAPTRGRGCAGLSVRLMAQPQAGSVWAPL